jgi:hypothetical protein
MIVAVFVVSFGSDVFVSVVQLDTLGITPSVFVISAVKLAASKLRSFTTMVATRSVLYIVGFGPPEVSLSNVSVICGFVLSMLNVIVFSDVLPDLSVILTFNCIPLLSADAVTVLLISVTRLISVFATVQPVSPETAPLSPMLSFPLVLLAVS